MSWLDFLHGWLKPNTRPNDVREPPPDPPLPPALEPSAGSPSQLAEPSVEIFAASGHGRTSYLWALLYMLRQIGQVWPGVVCWPRDEATGEALKAVHENLRLGRLPRRGFESEKRYALELRSLRPWGPQRLVIFDRPDPVFAPQRSDQDAPFLINWRAQILWLLSLSDLDQLDSRHLDITLEDLLRARNLAAPSIQLRPFRLVVALTKSDAVPDLPPELRCFLKEDPIAKTVTFDHTNAFRADLGGETELGETLRQASTVQRDKLLELYLVAMQEIDRVARDWLAETQGGRNLIRRAEDYGVELRVCVVSATGSGILSESRLGTAWSPRRVLDPYFWALELEKEIS